MKKRMLSLFFAACVVFFFSGCRYTQENFAESGQNELIEYTFDDSENNVKFSIKYPKDWTITVIDEENITLEEARSAGISFTFFNDDNEIFSIVATLIMPFEVDESLFEHDIFQTDLMISADKYTRSDSERTWTYYIFGDGEKLPHYCAVINMSCDNYGKMINEIENVIRSLEF